MVGDLGLQIIESDMSLPTSKLTSDGRLVLEIAACLADSTIMETAGRSYVRGHATGIAGGECLWFFVGQPNLEVPASSNSHAQAGANYIRICQLYVRQIRFLCLRILADNEVLFGVGGQGTTFAFPRKPKHDLPFGVEALWLSDKNWTNTSVNLVPDWYSEAISGLSPTRRSLYHESVAYAILFTILHERGHLSCRHHARPHGISRHQQELQADAVAADGLLVMIGAGMSHEDRSVTFAAMTIGLLAAFMVFHLLVLRKSATTAGREYHQGYPTAGERLSEVARLIARFQLDGENSALGDAISFMRICNQVAGLHPAFAFVVGTG